MASPSESFKVKDKVEFEQITEDDSENMDNYNEGETPIINQNGETVILQDNSTDRTFEKDNDSPTKRRRKPLKVRKLVFSESSLEERRTNANTMERKRMRSMNCALSTLRGCLPDEYKIKNKKMSKIRTLRVAMGYIKALEDMLKLDDATQRQREIERQVLLHEHLHFRSLHAQQLQMSMCSQYSNSPYTNVTPEPFGMFYGSPQSGQTVFPFSPFPMSGISRATSLGYSVHGSPPSLVKTGVHFTDNRHYSATPDCNPPMLPPSTPLNLSCKYSASRSETRVPPQTKRQIASTYPSPAINRNTNELNSSFLSSTSEEIRDTVNDVVPEPFGIDGVFPLPSDDDVTVVHQAYSRY